MIETALNLGTVATGMDILTLHAGVLERGGRALVMPGQSGSGKSTLTAALAHQGWRLLSDELALIRLDDGALLPLVRPISLKNASIDLIATRVGGAAVGRRHEGTVKGTIAYCRPPRGAVERGEEPAPCGWIVFPRYDADRPTAITPMDKIVAFGSAFGQSGNYRALGRPAFDVLTDLIDRCPAFALTFKDLDEAIACIDRVTAAS
jgi:HprK-related kinase A